MTTLDLSDSKSSAQPINNGDSIVINPILKSDLRFVSVKGNVARPGKYQWREGLRVSDIFPSVKGRLNKSSDLDYSIIVRTFNDRNDISVVQFDLGNAILKPHSIDNVELQPQDEILVFTRYNLEAFTKDFAIKETQDELLTILDAGQRAKLERVELSDSEQVKEKDPEIDFEKASLMTGLTQEEIELALASTRKKLLTPLLMLLQEQSAIGKRVQTAEVLGEVRFPGIYPITDRETVKDLIIAAGD
nr:SLBB domain-containing protein [Agarivorans gilvus]